MTRPTPRLDYGRAEFTKAQRKDMLRRSGGTCEATGEPFGLPAGHRCNADLAAGVRFEHVHPDACGGAAELENGAAVCPSCWRWKTDNVDQPMTAKTVRVREKALGLRKPKGRPMPGSRRSGWKTPMNGPAHRR